MVDLVYLMIGIVAALVVGGMVIYLWPYQTLRGEHARTLAALTEFQARSDQLQSALLEEQSKGYQGRQTMLIRQKRLESDLAEASERQAELERQHADFKERGEQQLQAQRQEAAQLREAIDRLEREQIALQDRFAQKGAEWDDERQSLLLLNSQLHDQVQGLHQDKTQLSAQLDQQQESSERERLALQIQMNTLEDRLALQKAQGGSGLSPDNQRRLEQLREVAELRQQRAAWEEERQAFQEQLERLQAERRSLHTQLQKAQGGSGLSPDNERWLEQLRAEVAELRQQRAAWEEERQAFQEQLKRLQAERRSLGAPIAMGSGAAVDVAGPEVEALRQQLVEARQECHNLQKKQAAHDVQTEQERGALEAEIEQLMERLLRVQRGPAS